ncbi:MAG TPA: hypothetical protein VIL13_12820 [Longimicrobiales bacterium]|jgi:hypothetical protein
MVRARGLGAGPGLIDPAVDELVMPWSARDPSGAAAERVRLPEWRGRARAVVAPQ